jgi:molybdenum-dependent DNA-binding transcriptional regulator ModE
VYAKYKTLDNTWKKQVVQENGPDVSSDEVLNSFADANHFQLASLEDLISKYSNQRGPLWYDILAEDEAEEAATAKHWERQKGGKRGNLKKRKLTETDIFDDTNDVFDEEERKPEPTPKPRPEPRPEPNPFASNLKNSTKLAELRLYYTLFERFKNQRERGGGATLNEAGKKIHAKYFRLFSQLEEARFLSKIPFLTSTLQYILDHTLRPSDDQVNEFIARNGGRLWEAGMSTGSQQYPYHPSDAFNEDTDLSMEDMKKLHMYYDIFEEFQELRERSGQLTGPVQLRLSEAGLKMQKEYFRLYSKFNIQLQQAGVAPASTLKAIIITAAYTKDDMDELFLSAGGPLWEWRNASPLEPVYYHPFDVEEIDDDARNSNVVDIDDGESKAAPPIYGTAASGAGAYGTPLPQQTFLTDYELFELSTFNFLFTEFQRLRESSHGGVRLTNVGRKFHQRYFDMYNRFADWLRRRGITFTPLNYIQDYWARHDDDLPELHVFELDNGNLWEIVGSSSTAPPPLLPMQYHPYDPPPPQLDGGSNSPSKGSIILKLSVLFPKFSKQELQNLWKLYVHHFIINEFQRLKRERGAKLTETGKTLHADYQKASKLFEQHLLKQKSSLTLPAIFERMGQALRQHLSIDTIIMKNKGEWWVL